MLFRPEKYLAWDTWAYYYDHTYYVYYLITDRSPGEGFGVAVSDDGVHFKDLGKCVSASDKMVFYLGTGAVWKSPDFGRDGRFLCNYSEWRKDETGANVQNIFFAYSHDLVQWKKLGDERMFKVDENYYKKYELDGGRWDCIFPYIDEDGKYHGLFTATPKDYLGCGYATSEDGIVWTAHKPPEFAISDKNIREGIELGAVCKHGEKFYLLMGTYVNEYGIAVLTSDTIDGRYVPQKKNFSLLANRSFRHAYFMRFFEKDGELLVNHHCISRTENEYSRPITFLAPFKKVDFDGEGILRLKWFEANDALKGSRIKMPSQKGFFAEGRLRRGLALTLKNGVRIEFAVGLEKGALDIYEDGELREEVRKETAFSKGNFVLLVRGEFVELYIDDWFLTAYTLPDAFDKMDCDGDVSFYEMDIER